MQKTVVIDAVGLSPALIGPHTPRIRAFAARGTMRPLETVLPAVTCSVQSSFVTGRPPTDHGIVANGWYYADTSEVRLWQQSNHLVEGPKLWDRARELDPTFTCANQFWWFAMYSSVDYTVTPRPMYPADGRKLPDIWTHPADLRPALQAELGQFPLFKFWGPQASIDSTRWIAESAKWTERAKDPTLTLIYLPHLDYPLQKLGPDPAAMAADLRQLDDVCGDLIDFYEERGAQVVVLSEYGITAVDQPVHINRLLREHGLIAVREEEGREVLDAGASAAFAVADHQVAHVYVNDPGRAAQVRELLEGLDGVAAVLDEDGKREAGLDHPRAGRFVALSEPRAWFTYYFWLDDERAPDYARTVDIHRKPGYDPVELFLDPALRVPMLKVGTTLARKTLGFRYLMDVIPLDASLVKGSHGLVGGAPDDGPLFITSAPELLEDRETVRATDVHDLVLEHLQPVRERAAASSAT